MLQMVEKESVNNLIWYITILTNTLHSGKIFMFVCAATCHWSTIRMIKGGYLDLACTSVDADCSFFS